MDCDTLQPLPFLPGAVSLGTLYTDAPSAGWRWMPYDSPAIPYYEPVQRGEGLDGSAASCLRLPPGTGLMWDCRQCYLKGYQPFAAGKSNLEFWIKPYSDDGNGGGGGGSNALVSGKWHGLIHQSVCGS